MLHLNPRQKSQSNTNYIITHNFSTIGKGYGQPRTLGRGCPHRQSHMWVNNICELCISPLSNKHWTYTPSYSAYSKFGYVDNIMLEIWAYTGGTSFTVASAWWVSTSLHVLTHPSCCSAAAHTGCITMSNCALLYVMKGNVAPIECCGTSRKVAMLQFVIACGCM